MPFALRQSGRDDSDGSAPTVLIDTGVYHEKVVIKRKNPLVFLVSPMLYGVDDEVTANAILSMQGVTGTPSNPSANGVVIWQSTFVNQNDPSDRKANCDAVTLGVGATDGGTGNTDFKAYNINFVQKQIRNGQEVTQEQLGPSAALCVLNSRASFYSCGFSSYQDTVFVGAGSQALFFRSIVKGMTDQLYGEGRLWVEKCLLLSRACGGGITAWRGKPGDSKAGVYISNSRIDKSPDAQTLRPMQGKCHLGRPWNAFAQSVYLNTYMTDIVAPEGFKTWNKQQSNFDLKTTHFYEFNSSGPGATPKQRDRSVQHLLTANQAAAYTYQRVLDSTADWIDIRILQSSSSKRASKKRHRPHTVFHTSPLHATQLSAEM